MTDDDICKLLDKLKVPDQWDDSVLIGFARAIEKASRNAALEDAAKTVGALHEKISAQEIIGFDAWSAGHMCLDNAACYIRALANGDSNG